MNSPASRPTIYWLILTYQRPDSFFRLVKSIQRQTITSKFDHVYVIWDNAGESETWRRFCASELVFPGRTDYVTSLKNLKMSGKRALEDHLFRRITPRAIDWVAHLDDDVVLSPEWLNSAHTSALQYGWDASGSTEIWDGNLIYSGQTSLEMIHDQGGRKELWRWKFERVDPCDSPREVVFAGHRALLVRASIANLIRHDSNFLIGGEDLDYSLSLAAAGAKLGIAPSALIRHRAHGETDAIDFRTSPDVVKSWRSFYKKWGFVRDNAATEAAFSVEDWLRVIREDIDRL